MKLRHPVIISTHLIKANRACATQLLFLAFFQIKSK